LEYKEQQICEETDEEKEEGRKKKNYVQKL
jgi:hypothetical protein